MKKIAINIILILSLVSCKKFVEVEMPSTQLVSQTVFSNDKTATAAQLAIYAQMETDGLVYQQIAYTGLSADEFLNFATGTFSVDLASNNLTSDNSIILSFWANYYKYIYQANAILEALTKSSSLSAPVKKQLTGEAKFVRAFCHFYLFTLFGEIPIVKGTDYRINSLLARNSISEVLSFIEEDLKEAVTSLSPNYLDASNSTTTERVRPNRYAAQAMLARVYLQSEKWNEAEASASNQINANYQIISNLDQVFLKNSGEAIWQLQSVVPNYNTYPGAQLILTTTPSVVALDTNLVKAFSIADKRKLHWLKSLAVNGRVYYYPFKYKVRQNASSITEYSMVLRLSEQYLIRAEARLKQGNIAGAEEDINVIRSRAGLTPLHGLSSSALMDSIFQERRFELFTEFGDRWHTLKRSGKADQVMPIVKGTNWTSTDALYPIPLSEITKNGRLTQNPGY